jgi:hypothetical protein
MTVIPVQNNGLIFNEEEHGFIQPEQSPAFVDNEPPESFDPTHLTSGFEGLEEAIVLWRSFRSKTKKLRIHFL